MSALEKFLKYVKIDTQSDPYSIYSPTTKKQFDLANVLVEDLREVGLQPILSKECYVYARVLSNSKKEVEPFGLCAHMDVSPDAPSKNIIPHIIKNYQVEDIVLTNGDIISKDEYSFLQNLKSHDLVVTSGDTLLGGDDKAGIAQIMGLLEYINEHKDFEHGDIFICFTPDEEVGKGVDNIDYSIFNVKKAYTIDGGAVGDIEYENFNAASAKVLIKGIGIHPGSAKNKMVNASLLAYEFNSMLPVNEIPRYTSGYEGFYHLSRIEGSVEEAKIEYIVRNHSKELFNKQKEYLQSVAKYINSKYGYKAITLKIKDSYYNMYDIISKDLDVVEYAIEAIKKVGLTPKIEPIRGGTDGARLTYAGVLTPNLGTGAYNFHSRKELLSINELYLGIDILKEIVSKYVSNSK
ncbi:MAG: peptidase T [Acholeplasmatales bacterium]|jgi:tripeptide aminopeptidase|nr:peptidase T [Acholeplasmatales bacterium]